MKVMKRFWDDVVKKVKKELKSEEKVEAKKKDWSKPQKTSGD